MYRYRSAMLALLLLLLPAAAVLAVGQGRLQATVVDENGEPVPGVEVRIFNDQIAYEKTLTTNKKGSFTLLVIDATRPYTMQLKKEGYRPTQQVIKLEAGGVARETYTLPSNAAAPVQASPEDIRAAEGRNKAVKAFNEGVILAQAGDTAAAKEKFLEAHEIDPEMPQPYSALAGIYIDEGSYAEAVEMSKGLLELDPQNVRALQILYDSYTELGNAAEAQAALDQLAALEDGGTDAAVRVFNQGAEAIRVGDVDTARERFEKAAELDPDLAPAHAALAGLYLEVQEYQKAVDAAETALALDPDLTNVQRYRYEAYRRMGQEEKAKEVFAELAADDPEGLADTLYENGREAFNAGNTALAKTAFEQAITAMPDHARSHYMLGLVYVNQGEGSKAKEHLQKFIELAPDDPEVATARQMIEYAG